MKLNYYQILGISRSASQDDIKKAYRLLAYHFHPDRNNDTNNELSLINEAYRVLSNPSSRREYDYSLPKTDIYNPSTPKMKWVGDTIEQTSKPVSSMELSEARGVKKDILNFIAYLNIAPLYEICAYDNETTNTCYVHTMHYRK